MPDPQHPALTPDDFDAQDDLLSALREHDDSIADWEYCEGFLAALVCTRRPIDPAEYWPVLMGMEFRPMEHMEFTWRWYRRINEVTAALDAPVETLDDERCYQPALLDRRGAWLGIPEAERGGIAVTELPSWAEGWALGFTDAVEAWREEWAPPRDPDAAEMLDDALAVLEALTEPDTGPPEMSPYEEEGPPSVSNARMDLYAQAIWAVYDLRQLWKSLGPRQRGVMRSNEPGRNDPCPCGSGKKYKKCHGA